MMSSHEYLAVYKSESFMSLNNHNETWVFEKMVQKEDPKLTFSHRSTR